MTIDKFKKDFIKFLETSNVNLGRLQSKTRKEFLCEAIKRFNNFINSQIKENPKETVDEKPAQKRILCLKPTKKLDIGKGVHAMTAGESMAVDEQLGRSPYSSKGSNDEHNN